MAKISHSQACKRLREAASKIDKTLLCEKFSPAKRAELFKTMNRLMVLGTK